MACPSRHAERGSASPSGNFSAMPSKQAVRRGTCDEAIKPSRPGSSSPTPSCTTSTADTSPTTSPEPCSTSAPKPSSTFAPEPSSTSPSSTQCKTHLIRRPRTGHTTFTPGSRLENNLAWAVGCLELANAGDFAANIWNDVPVPLHAVVLMAVGATLAAVLSGFAFADARRAWRNICYLRTQRRELGLARRRRGREEGDVERKGGMREVGGGEDEETRRGEELGQRGRNIRGGEEDIRGDEDDIRGDEDEKGLPMRPNMRCGETEEERRDDEVEKQRPARHSVPAHEAGMEEADVGMQEACDTHHIDTAADAAPHDVEMAVLRAVTFRELWSEVINRWAMDLLMGGGAVLISVGTYMAIGGANPRVWHASNILSGYLGNTPIALFGLVNASWAVYVWRKAHGHVVALRSYPQSQSLPHATSSGSSPLAISSHASIHVNPSHSSPHPISSYASPPSHALRSTHLAAAALVVRRVRSLQIFYSINGSASLIGAAASLLTASYWWAYVLLIPVIISSIFCNIWWRRRVGYHRAHALPRIHPSALAADLVFAATAQRLCHEHDYHHHFNHSPFNHFSNHKHHRHQNNHHHQRNPPLLPRFLGPAATQLPAVLAFFTRHALIDALVLDLVSSSPQVRDALTSSSSSSATAKGAIEYVVGADDLAALPPHLHAHVVDVADTCLARVGKEHFRSRERFLAELLGTYCSAATKTGSSTSSAAMT